MPEEEEEKPGPSGESKKEEEELKVTDQFLDCLAEVCETLPPENEAEAAEEEGVADESMKGGRTYREGYTLRTCHVISKRYSSREKQWFLLFQQIPKRMVKPATAAVKVDRAAPLMKIG